MFRKTSKFDHLQTTSAPSETGHYGLTPIARISCRATNHRYRGFIDVGPCTSKPYCPARHIAQRRRALQTGRETVIALPEDGCSLRAVARGPFDVKDFLQFAGHRAAVLVTRHDPAHVPPPPAADFCFRNGTPLRKILNLSVSEQPTGFGIEEYRIIDDAVAVKRFLQLRPNRVMPPLIFLLHRRLDLHDKRDSVHVHGSMGYKKPAIIVKGNFPARSVISPSTGPAAHRTVR